MLSATSSQTYANASSSFLTTGSSVCSASFRYMAAWPRRQSGQSCMPNTVPLSLEWSPVHPPAGLSPPRFNTKARFWTDLGGRLRFAEIKPHAFPRATISSRRRSSSGVHFVLRSFVNGGLWVAQVAPFLERVHGQSLSRLRPLPPVYC